MMNNKTLPERTLGRHGITLTRGFFVSGTCDWRHVVNCEGLVEMDENGDVEP